MDGYSQKQEIKQEKIGFQEYIIKGIQVHNKKIFCRNGWVVQANSN